MPPSEPGHPSRSARTGPFGPGPGSGTARPPAGPGYGAPAGPGYGASVGPGYGSPAGLGYGPSAAWRPAPASAAGGSARPGPDGTFDGGYAQVIRPADHPVSPAGRGHPNPGRPADPARSAGSVPPTDRDVYVYRDVSDPAPKVSARHAAAEDAAYWYDLLAEDPAPRHEESRGPFEPLLSSSGTANAPGSAAAEQVPERSAAAGDEHHEPPEQARARKLEQLKDLYLTAEAIGEQNVDKHFDQLLAQQRELISEYFRQSAAAQPGGTGQAAGTGQAPQQTGGQATPPEGASVRAEPPRAW